MVQFPVDDREVIFGRFWRCKQRSAHLRFSFEEIREIEILHTREQYAKGSSGSGRPPVYKEKYYLSVISNLAEEPAYIIRLPRLSPLAEQSEAITKACGLPLVFEKYPP